MTRPQSAQDVFDALRRGRLVDPGALNSFVERSGPEHGDVAAVLNQLVSDGLVTAFQADEVSNGRGGNLWMGGYRLIDRLGRGGTSQVYLAEHTLLQKRVALKVLSEALQADPGARKRFVREARAAAALDHPNIVRVFDVNMAHDPPYLVMEYVDGVSLQAAVAGTGTFSVGETAAAGAQVADALVQAAAVGLVHRDIKPANLLLDRRGAVKVLDLGIARFMHDDSYSRVNGQELLLGTLDYLAPEQAENCSTVDIRADIYSLGATLYFLLVGHPPYPVADIRQKLSAKKTIDPTPVQELRPDVPSEFAALVHRLLSRDRTARPASPSQVAASLIRWAEYGSDFPGRLFRTPAGSTAHDRYPSSELDDPQEPLPETLRIVKKSARRQADGAAGATPDAPDGSPQAVLTAPSPPAPPVRPEAGDTDVTFTTRVNPALPANQPTPEPPAPAELPVPSAPTPAPEPVVQLPVSPDPPLPAESPTPVEPLWSRSNDRAAVALAFAAGMAVVVLLWLLTNAGR